MKDEAVHEETEYIPLDRDEFLCYHAATIRRVAERKYQQQGFCQADDVEQAIFEHVLKEWKYYEGSDEKSARSKFGKAADQYLGKEAQDFMYFTGSFVYTPSMVRNILEQSAWSEIEQAPDIDGRVDVRAGFDRLPPKQKAGVFQRYALKVPAEEQTEAEKRSTQRGVDGITHYLNKQTGKPRTYTMDELRQRLAQQL